MRDLSESQQSVVGELPVVIKFVQGVKLRIIEPVHDVLTWPYTGLTRSKNAIAKVAFTCEEVFNPSICMWSRALLGRIYTALRIN